LTDSAHMGVVACTHPALPPQTAAQLERFVGKGEAAARLRADLGRSHRDFSDHEVEEALDEAVAAAVKGCTAETLDDVRRYLFTTAARILWRRRDKRKSEVIVDPAGPGGAIYERDLALVVSAPRGLDDLLIERETQHEREQVVLAILADLTSRQREVLALRFHDDATTPEIARALDLSRKQVQRDLEKIMDKSRLRMAELAGGGCGKGDRLIMRRAFGLASAAEAAQATLHTVRCSECQEFRAKLRGVQELVAQLVAPAATAQQHDRSRSLLDALGWLRQQVADGGAQAHQATTAAAARVDPTPLAGIRPGAAGAMIAGCVLGVGGTVVCVDQHKNPYQLAKGILAPEPKRERPKPKAKRAQVAPPTATTPTATTPPPAATTTPTTTPAAAPPATTTTAPPSPPPPPPEQQIEPNTYTPPPSQASAPLASRTPAPVDDSSGVEGEFGGP
jgi:RNA polymerase sigma factor (sigma-70 family)